MGSLSRKDEEHKDLQRRMGFPFVRLRVLSVLVRKKEGQSLTKARRAQRFTKKRGFSLRVLSVLVRKKEWAVSHERHEEHKDLQRRMGFPFVRLRVLSVLVRKKEGQSLTKARRAQRFTKKRGFSLRVLSVLVRKKEWAVSHERTKSTKIYKEGWVFPSCAFVCLVS